MQCVRRQHSKIYGVTHAESDEMGLHVTAVTVDDEETVCGRDRGCWDNLWLKGLSESAVCECIVRPSLVGYGPSPVHEVHRL